jgi:hypothetical protein
MLIVGLALEEELKSQKNEHTRDVKKQFTVGIEAMPGNVLNFNADIARSSNTASEAMRLAICEAEGNENEETSTGAGSIDEVNNHVLDVVTVVE